METPLRFLHLSDIHFTDCDGSRENDLDNAVRERMLQDIAKMHDQLGDVDAVLVVGDIAARGKHADYDEAALFLNRTCDLVGLTEEQVVCVPGNHDIDRSQQGALHDAARFHLRRVEASKISEILLRLLREEDGRQTLLRPLHEYNKFALRYGCAIDYESLLWKPKILSLGSRNVHLHGVNSAWVCDQSDSSECDSERVVVGRFQLTPIAKDPSVVSIVLCHHPLRWLRDADLVEPWFAQAQVVLTGHEHEAGIEVSGDQRSLWIASGAVNPDEAHSEWTPAYNVIDLELITNDRLRVKVFSRSWQGTHAEFGPAGCAPQPFSCELPLGPFSEVPEKPDSVQSTQRSTKVVHSGGSSIMPPDPEMFVSNERAMVYRVMSASPDVRRRAARELGLLPEDKELGGLELDKRVLQCALEQGRLAELDERIINGQ